MRVQKTLAASLSLLLLLSQAWGVGHIDPKAYPKHKQDMIHRPSPKQMKRFGSMRAAIIGGSSGPKNVAVIIVQFPPSSGISGSNSIVSLPTIDGYFNSMRDYFTEVSKNNIDITFKFFGNLTGVNPLGSNTAQAAGVFTLASTEDYYGCGDEGTCAQLNSPTPNSVNANGNVLIRDALIAARAATTGPTSSNNGGSFDAVLIMHAGNGNETSSSSGDIWSIFYSNDGAIAGVAGAGFDEGIVFPETEDQGIVPLGVMCHEFGHELGLPDLYNTAVLGGSSVVGKWELMDSGPYNVGGTKPAHLGAWGKYNLGWVTPQTVSSGAVSIGYSETAANSLVKLNVTNGLPQEYFLIEYRSSADPGATFDKGLPGDGLLIWHVDDALATTLGISGDNSVNALTHSGHYGVSIIPKDGQSPSSNGGDVGDVFSNGDHFIPPTSNNFSSQGSGVSVVDISGVGGLTATLIVSISSMTSGQHIAKVINYPNPAGKGYPHSSGEGHTTIQFQLNRVAQDWSINIYTLSGDLVRKINKDQIHYKSLREDDFRFVYEYIWDLTNENGKHVAPGVYLYMIRADGESKSGKMVVIR
jgi:M6 family metalloprotease-like protein